MMTHQTLHREKQYTGPVFDIAKVFVRLPDGRERSYDLVEHGDSVTIVPVDANGQIYFVTQHRVGSEGLLLELPAGVLEEGEDPLVSARREIREEIGMDADQIIHLGGFFLAAGYSDEYMNIFLATGLYPSPLEPDEDEFLNMVTMSVETVYQTALAGEFQDCKTLAALLLAMPYIKNKSS
jgi:ADP-ribose pyrophosphatase